MESKEDNLLTMILGSTEWAMIITQEIKLQEARGTTEDPFQDQLV